MRLFHSECVDKHYYISKYHIWLMNVIICKSVKCYSLFNVKIKVDVSKSRKLLLKSWLR